MRTIAALFVAIPLVSCSVPEQSVPPSGAETPQSNVTPTGAIEVLPTPTVEAETSPIDSSATPVSDAEWTQATYGDSWTIGYPVEWTVNDAGAGEGALQIEGEYAGHTYLVTYSYPIGILAASLESWVDEMLLPLTSEQRAAVVLSNVMVANTPAKKVLNFPTPDGTATAHHVYIWRTDANAGSDPKNPRLITITQTDGQAVDAVAMDQLLDRILVNVQ